MLHSKFRFIWPSSFRGKYFFFKSTNQEQELPVAAMHGRWFYPGTPASSTTKANRHDIAEILLKVALKHQKEKRKSLFL
jgi:hypothetical protein